jgi:hypothetical protein
VSGQVRISAAALVKDIKDGLTDDQLTAKYDISLAQLQRLFSQLVERGLITQSELDARKPLTEDLIELDDEPSARPPEFTRTAPPESYPQQFPAMGGGPYEEDAELKRYGRNAVLGIVLGLVAQVAGGIIGGLAKAPPTRGQVPEWFAVAGPLIALIGMGLFIWGCYCLMKKKGRHGALALLGLFGCFGLIILLVLPNRHKESPSSVWVAVAAIFGVLVAFVFLAGIVLAIAIPYYVAYKRTACDRAVSADVGKLAAALERLKNEAKDYGMEFDEGAVDTFVENNGLKYVVGPYYGWRGCTKKCGSVIRLNKQGGRWVVEGVAVKGSHPGGVHSRYIYRTYVTDRGDLPAAIGRNITDANDGKTLHWNSYPAGKTLDGGRCYTDSILGKPGASDSRALVIRPPGRSTPCGSLLKK